MLSSLPSSGLITLSMNSSNSSRYAASSGGRAKSTPPCCQPPEPGRESDVSVSLGASAVVEVRLVETHQLTLARRHRPLDGLRRDVVDLGRRTDPLGDVASAVVHLQEQ